MGTSIRWVEGTHIIRKKHLNISISDRGVKNGLKELIYLQYDQNLIFVLIMNLKYQEEV